MKLIKSILICLLVLLGISTCVYADSGETGFVVIAKDDFSSYGVEAGKNILLKDYQYTSSSGYGMGFVTNWSSDAAEYTAVDSDSVSYRRINKNAPQLYHMYNPNLHLYRRLQRSIDFDKSGERYIFSFEVADTTPPSYGTNGWKNVDFRFYLGSDNTYFGYVGGEGNTLVPQICVGDTRVSVESDLTMSSSSIATSTPRYIFELMVETCDGPDSLRLRAYKAGSDKSEEYILEAQAELGGLCEYIGFSPSVSGKSASIRVYDVIVEQYLPSVNITDYFFVDNNNKCLYDAVEVTDSLMLKLKLKSTHTEPKDVSVFLALYDEDRLLCVTKEDVSVPEASETDYILVGYDGKEKLLPALDTSSLKVKCFVWYN